MPLQIWNILIVEFNLWYIALIKLFCLGRWIYSLLATQFASCRSSKFGWFWPSLQSRIASCRCCLLDFLCSAWGWITWFILDEGLRLFVITSFSITSISFLSSICLNSIGSFCVKARMMTLLTFFFMNQMLWPAWLFSNFSSLRSTLIFLPSCLLNLFI